MTHALAGADQDATRVGERGAVEETDVDVLGECVYIREGRILDAAHGTVIMEYLLHISSTRQDLVEPPDGNRSQVFGLLGEPNFKCEGLKIFVGVLKEWQLN